MNTLFMPRLDSSKKIEICNLINERVDFAKFDYW